MDTLRDNYRFLARYNRWMNEKLVAASSQLTPAERSMDRGAFFGSVHGTLNHLVWGDCLWLARFADQGIAFDSLPAQTLCLPEGASHGTILHARWDELTCARATLDAAIQAWCEEMPADFPMRTMRYANTRGVLREHPMWQALTHFFNHQTHHRGQWTTLLTQAGVDPGVTDLVALV